MEESAVSGAQGVRGRPVGAAGWVSLAFQSGLSSSSDSEPRSCGDQRSLRAGLWANLIAHLESVPGLPPPPPRPEPIGGATAVGMQGLAP